MMILFFIAAAACILYFAVIVAYSGFSAFCLVWILFAAVFALMGIFVHRRRKRKKELPGRTAVFIYTTFCLGLLAMAVVMNSVLYTARRQPERDNQFIIVLGTKVYSDGISNTLKLRLDKAWEYYTQHPEVIFVLSGGQGRDEVLPEAMSMYNYLYLKGVPEEQLFMEMRSKNTVENIRFSGEVIDEMLRGPGRKKGHVRARIGILTSDYHLMRALLIARSQDYKNVRGIAADSDKVLYVHQCVRESAAVLKDYIFGNFSIMERPKGRREEL